MHRDDSQERGIGFKTVFIEVLCRRRAGSEGKLAMKRDNGRNGCSQVLFIHHPSQDRLPAAASALCDTDA
jgi:hypothetical protein